MDSTHKCPRCNYETLGTNTTGAPIVCPRCKREGVVIQMIEKRNQFNENLGDGLFRKKKLTENM